MKPSTWATASPCCTTGGSSRWGRPTSCTSAPRVSSWPRSWVGPTYSAGPRRVFPGGGRSGRAVRSASGTRRRPGGGPGPRRGGPDPGVPGDARVKRSEAAGALVTLLLVWMVIYPIAIVAREAAAGGAFAEFVSRPSEWRALWASLWISLASIALAAAIGVPLAFLFEWFEFPGRKTLGALVALPVVLPPLVGVIAFLFLYGESRFVARFIQAVFGFERAPWQLQGAGAILLVHAYSFYVYFYLLTRAGLAKLDASMLEAAQALGAGRWRTMGKVVLPLLRPSLTGAAMLTFMTALGSFSAPFLFGGGFRVMPTQILASKTNGEIPLAMVETVALVAVGKGTAPRRRAIATPGVRALATAAGWLFAAFLLLPHLTLALVSLVPYASWTTEALPPVLSLVNYQRLFSEPERLTPLVTSLWMAAVSTTLALGIALGAGWLAVRLR